MRRLLIVSGLLLVAVGSSNGWIFSKPIPKEDPSPEDDDPSDGELRAKPFAAGKEFTFGYQSQISSGLLFTSTDDDDDLASVQRKAPSQRSSMRLGAQVRIAMRDGEGDKGQMQLRQLKVGVLNRHIAEPDKMQRWDFYELRSLGQQEMKYLQAPVDFSLKNGQIKELTFPKAEKEWSRNWKKAILNMLQLNLQPVRNNGGGGKGGDEEGPHLSSFNTHEVTVEGACNVSYSLSHQNKAMNVTKSIDFQSCNQTADVTFGFSSMESQMRCSQCAQMKRELKQKREVSKEQKETLKQCLNSCDSKKVPEGVLERSTTIQYALKGEPKNYGIQRVRLSSEYIFREPTIGAGSGTSGAESVMHTIALAELLYQGMGESPEKTQGADQQQQQEKETESLLYNNKEVIGHKRYYMYGEADDRLPNEGHRHSKDPFSGMPHRVEQAAELLRKILRQTSFDHSNGIPTQAVLHLQQLTDLLRKCSESDIRELYSKFGAEIGEGSGGSGNGRRGQSMWSRENGAEQQQQQQQQDSSPSTAKQNKKGREVLDGCLASAGTHNSLLVLIDRIASVEMGAGQAALALKTIGLTAHSPSDKHISQLLRLCQKSQVENGDEALRQSCWLTTGALINQVCTPASNTTQQEVGQICGKQKKREYAKALTKNLEEAVTLYNKMLALKALGNAGMPSTFNFIASRVNNRRGAQERGGKEQQIKQSTFVRIAAIDALHRLRHTMGKEIQRLLLPIFHDAREEVPVRIAAFWYTMSTQPSAPVLNQIVYSLTKERSQQLFSFVYSTLKDLSEQPHKEPSQRKM